MVYYKWIYNYYVGSEPMNQELKSNLSRKAIIAAATEEFSQNRFVTMSINRLCANHSISKGKLYHHFESKEELFLACLESGWADFAKCYDQDQIMRGTTLEERFHILFSLRQKFMADNPFVPNMLYDAIQDPQPQLKERISEIRATFYLAQANAVRAIIEKDGIFEEKDIPMYTEIFVAASTYINFSNKPSFVPYGDNSSLIKDSIRVFDRLVKIFLYGAYPR